MIPQWWSTGPYYWSKGSQARSSCRATEALITVSFLFFMAYIQLLIFPHIPSKHLFFKPHNSVSQPGMKKRRFLAVGTQYICYPSHKAHSSQVETSRLLQQTKWMRDCTLMWAIAVVLIRLLSHHARQNHFGPCRKTRVVLWPKLRMPHLFSLLAPSFSSLKFLNDHFLKSSCFLVLAEIPGKETLLSKALMI